MGSHSVTCQLTEVTSYLLKRIKAGTRLSDPRGMQGRVDRIYLFTYLGGIPARRWSPIPVLTGFNVEQLRSFNEQRYRYAKPPTNGNAYYTRKLRIEVPPTAFRSETLTITLTLT